MAEGVIISIAERIIANLASERLNKISLPWGLKNELCKLESTISTMKAVLLDAEEKKANNQVKAWLDKIEDAIYDADNLLDEFRYEKLRRKLDFPRKKKVKKVRIFFSSSNQLVFGRKIATKIKEIRETLDDIKAQRDFHLEESLEVTRVSSTMNGRETHSFVTDVEVVGRDYEKQEILKFLLDTNVETREGVPIVSLVGIGGLGKTTLAQFVFNDELVKRYFEKRMWVCVSDVFHLRPLVEKIVRSATEIGPYENLNLEQLQNRLRPEMQGKKYLLVLDDVWNEDGNKWDALSTFLKLGATGSRVLITTRSRRVAQVVHSTKTHILSGLDKSKSWDLYQRVAFEEINELVEYPRLVEIGKDILDKCKGVPLAIKTIGRLLQSKKYSAQNLEREWKSFRDNELAKVAFQNESDIMPTLKLSYNNLPPHLKHCFAYCSLFPKDHKINVQQLIKLWMAQGFLKLPEDNQPCLEDIGYEHFMTLFSRCFFQEVKMDEFSGSVVYCKMHDLMHDLAVSVAGKCTKMLDESADKLERATTSTGLVASAENPFDKVRHIYVNFGSDSSFRIPTPLLEQKKMRTFIAPKSKGLSSLECDGIQSNFKFLRALRLKINSDVKTLPNSLGRLKHLRYLDLSVNDSIRELPDSITSLQFANINPLIL